MKKKLKIKKGVWVILAIIIILITGGIYGYNKYQEHLYHQTYEYKLLQKGYNIEETHFLEKNFSKHRLDYFLKIDKNENIIAFRKEKYFLDKNLEKYLEYQKNNKNVLLADTVSIINTHRDTDYYTNVLNTDYSMNEQMLVNKYYNLSSDYQPDDVMMISSSYAWGENNSKSIRKITFDAYLNMYNAAKHDGITLMINSGYRTYDEQQTVYTDYEEKYGNEYADEIAARPGHSEHQTGLALDIFCTTNSNRNTFKDSEAYQWLLNNSYKYGFILRYPEGKEDITGFTFESWHYRYVGNEIAKYIYENDITFDEYYAYFIEK